MRIAFLLTQAYSIGGASIYVRDLAIALKQDKGNDVKVFVGGKGPFLEILENENIAFESLKYLVREISPLKDILAYFEIRKALKIFSPDIVHCNSSKAGLIGRLVCKNLGIPNVFTAHGWSFTEGHPWWKRTLFCFLERHTIQCATKVIDVSNYDKELALRNNVGQDSQHVVIQNGVPDIIDLPQARPGEWPPKLIMVARFDAPKNQEIILRALAAIKDQAWQLDFVGDGPLKKQAENLASSLGVANKVKFLGEREDVPFLLSSSQVFVLTSNWEGLPLSIIEAMRAGLPIISSDVGGCKELVKDGVNGYLVGSKDQNSLMDKLVVLLKDANKRIMFGKKSREFYEERFTFEKTFQKTSKLYEQILGRCGVE